jgi:hypothetical protein
MLFSLPHSEKKNMEVAIFKHYHSWRLPKCYKTLENLILSSLTCSQIRIFLSSCEWVATEATLQNWKNESDTGQ